MHCVTRISSGRLAGQQITFTIVILIVASTTSGSRDKKIRGRNNTVSSLKTDKHAKVKTTTVKPAASKVSPTKTDRYSAVSTSSVPPIASKVSEESWAWTPAGYEHFPGYGWYKVYREDMNWVTARSLCQQDGADLLVLETELEREEVHSKLYPTGYYIWLGAHDPEHNGSWVSVHGESVPNSWWWPGEPDIPGWYCGYTRDDGLLRDGNCDVNLSVICKIHDIPSEL